MRSPTNAQRLVAVAKLLEEQAIEVNSAAHRLKALGQLEPAQKALKVAHQLARMSADLTHTSSDGLRLFFGIGERSTECESVATALDGAPTSMPWVDNL